MDCSNPLIVDTRPIYTIPTPQVISRMIPEDNLVNWRKYTETVYLDYDTPSCPIMVFGSDEIFSICDIGLRGRLPNFISNFLCRTDLSMYE